VCTPILLASSYFISSPNTTVSGQGPLDWVYLGAADSAASRATAVQIGDVSGAKYAILGGSFDLTFVKHVCNTNTWATAFTIQGNSINNNVPDVTFNNNVGVGIFSPGARLDVLSTLNVQATGNSDVPYINFSNNGRSFDWGRVGGLLQGDGDGALYFSTKLGGGVTEKLRITSTGIACFSNTICAKSLWFSSNSTGQITFGANDACNAYVVSDTNNSLYVGNNNSYKILVPNDGTDMIFRTAQTYGNPEERVRLNRFGQLLINAPSSTYSANLFGYNLGVRGTNNQTFISIARANQTLDTQGIIFGLDSATAYLFVHDNIPLTFSNNGSERMRISSAGVSCFACQVCAPSFQAGSSIGIDRSNPPVSFAIGQAFGNTYSIHRGTSSLTSSACTTLFTVCVPLHHSANVEVHAFEDWGAHSSIYYTGKWVISNSETLYNAPGGFQVYAPVNNSYNGDCFMATWSLASCNSSPAGAFLFRMRTNNGSTSVRFVATIMGNTVWIG
jgi:hypothetical protein